jgi:hypothetical protein
MELPGSDSFLDVVTNIVGILIILIVVVGTRARQSPLTVDSALAPEQAALSAAKTQAQSLYQDVHQLEAQGRQIDAESIVRRAERDQLATVIAAAQRELGTARDSLSADERADYDLRREIALARQDLERTLRQRAAVENAPTKTTTIENYPTPLSKPVDGKEIHIQLRGGRATFIPLDELIERFKASAQQKVVKLRDRNEFTETIGPIGGFRLRYTLERKDIPPETVMETGRGGTIIQLAKYELIPTSSQLGEPIEQALSEKSILRAQLDGFKPEQYTVTLWTYEDSFDAFRALRKELYHRGFAVAARPLPKDVPIGGSPSGSKSAAQ